MTGTGLLRRVALMLLVVVAVAGRPWSPVRAQDAATESSMRATGATDQSRAEADTVHALFRRANELAFAENYAGALEVYGALTDVGIVDPDVEQNIAVCYARTGRLARAIFHFERALLLRPGDEGIERGLAAVEDALARARAEAEGEAELATDKHFVRAMVRSVSEQALAIALLSTVALLCLALVARRRAQDEVPRVAAGVASLFALVLCVVAAVGLVVKQGWLRDGVPAVVLEDEVPLHQSPDARSPVLDAPARAGERGVVLDEYEGFVRLRLGARQGWARTADVGQLR
ncbi:MAG: tetratricopeptide repeat protein [Polyangiales bacterium]|nr:tetratricopeptide repeat protein [Myxococcales bacterium]MCB9658569.1 tetratricopeptide repeat protein [Sandaracinaceae bacterium]